MKIQLVCGIGGVVLWGVGALAGTDPWADRVVSYNPGTGIPADYKSAATSLGEPARTTGDLYGFPAAVTPFSPAFEPDEIVGVGGGGRLVVAFDEPVTNDAGNPYGIDLIVFGHSGYVDDDYPAGLVRGDAARFGVGQRPLTEVSADGQTWIAVTARVDDFFPTNAYVDLADPYSTVAGSIPSDFTRPVNPALNPAGMSFAQLVAAYDGSGGGAGIDLAPTGLSSISYVRFTNVLEGTASFYIDGLADVSPVPTPAGGAVVLGLITNLARRRRRDT